MATNYPATNDSFGVPSSPSTTTLSSAGDSTRNHIQHHQDLGDAVVALERYAALANHDHSGTEARPTSPIKQVNSHNNPDTDFSGSSLHHTLGTSANQAASGNHVHNQSTSHYSADTDTDSSAIHHTLGVGENQAAAGDHGHPGSIYTLGTGHANAAYGDHAHTNYATGIFGGPTRTVAPFCVAVYIGSTYSVGQTDFFAQSNWTTDNTYGGGQSESMLVKAGAYYTIKIPVTGTYQIQFHTIGGTNGAMRIHNRVTKTAAVNTTVAGGSAWYGDVTSELHLDAFNTVFLSAGNSLYWSNWASAGIYSVYPSLFGLRTSMSARWVGP